MMANTPKPSRKSLVKISCAIFLVATLAGCDSQADGTQAPRLPTKVSTIQILGGTANQTLSISGLTEPYRRTTPASRLMAKVLKVNFQEGDRVTTGQTLVRLDSRDLSARQQQTRAAVNTASTAYANSQRNLVRMQSLAESGTISQTQYENMQVAHAQAAAALSAAQAARNELNVNLSDSTIVAPFDGVIVSKLIEQGDTVSPGQPMFVIEDDSKLRVVAAVASDLANSLTPGQALDVRLSGQQLKGAVEAVVPSGVSGAAGLRLQVLVENRVPRLRSGSLATIGLRSGSDPNTAEILIPNSALVRHGQLNGVLVVDPSSRARLRWLVTGEQTGAATRILAGLKLGDRVIIKPQGITDGQLVTENSK